MNLEDIDRAHLIHPITEFRTHERKGPVVVSGGEGIRIHTTDGRTLIDGCSGLFNMNVGHGRTEIADAVAKLSVALKEAKAGSARPRLAGRAQTASLRDTAGGGSLHGRGA